MQKDLQQQTTILRLNVADSSKYSQFLLSTDM